MAEELPHVLYCHCSYAQVAPAATRRAMLAALRNSGRPATIVADLCQMAAQRDPRLGQLAQAGPLTVLACQARSVRALFQAAGVDLPATGVAIHNLREESPEAVLGALGLAPPPPGGAPVEEPARSGDWIPWFPVIDQARCKNCRQCLNFCLFGVYEAADDGTIEVTHPEQCKTNCPACARICPEVAIIFAKSPEAPINGAEITDEEAARANVKVNVQQILGDDVYAALAARRRKRALLNPQGLARALAERSNHTGDR